MRIPSLALALLFLALPGRAAEAQRGATLQGGEVPFHVVAENFLSLLESTDDPELPDLLGLDPAIIQRLALVRPAVMKRYSAAVMGVDPNADCQKTGELARGLAETHRELGRLPWPVFLGVIDRTIRPGIAMHSSDSREAVLARQREMALCWAEGVLAVYPEGPVEP